MFPCGFEHGKEVLGLTAAWMLLLELRMMSSPGERVLITFFVSFVIR